MTFNKLSPKQKQIFRWPYHTDYKAIICDGAVRSGKTICMITSYILWAMKRFNNSTFGICGKTVRSAERNIIVPMQSIVDITHYYKIKYTRSVNLLTVEGGGRKNFFYIFGGKDESSYMLIQGITLSGVFFDEVALMPQSFVDQAITRTLSVPESTLWFNCNPGSSEHWFYKNWVCKSEEQKALHLHFLMSDNPILSAEQIEFAEKQFQGVFRDRYILGKWVVAEGLVYPMWSENYIVEDFQLPDKWHEWYVSMDYGTVNPCSMGLWCVTDNEAIRVSEYYYNGRENNRRTDEEHYAELERLVSGRDIQAVIIDPSAASFIECIHRHGKYSVRRARNEVLDGIRRTSTLISSGKIKVCKTCEGFLKEVKLYCWDEKANEDTIIKENDHAMDDTRYLVNTILKNTILRDIDGGENND